MSTTAPPPAPEQQPAPPARRGMQGSIKNMIISMLAVLAGCVVWLWAVPQQSEQVKAVDGVPSIAREVSKQQKWQVALPAGLSKEWTPVNVRLIEIEDRLPTWHAGYQAPDDEFVSAEQTKGGDQEWVRQQTQGGKSQGKVTIDGVTWEKRADGDFRSLVRAEPLGGLETVVTGKGDFEQLEQFAGALRPSGAN